MGHSLLAAGQVGKAFNNAVSQGQAPGIAQATMSRDEKTVLRFLSGTAVHVGEKKGNGKEKNDAHYDVEH